MVCLTELKIGQTVETEYGGEVKIISKLGSGGQGIVYLVEVNGVKKALKWYDISKIRNLQAFKKNIEANIKDGTPSDKFLWPEVMVREDADGNFGYIMDLRPSNYDSFVDILNMYRLSVDPATGKGIKEKVQFASLFAMITAAINIINAFRQLHRAGKSYQDLNDGGFFIDTKTGDVLVCDCDNIAPEGYNFGIGGKPGYMAPEVVRGIAKPDVQTDKYSLGVVLFKLLFRGDPLEGEKVVKSVCLTEESELLHYGKDAVFVFDPDNDTNRPVRGIHDNVIKLWPIYPSYIRNAFTDLFTNGIKKPNKRLIENEWQKLFVRLRSEIIPCVCGRTTYSSMFETTDHGTLKCRKCGSEYPILKFDNGSIIPLYENCRLYACNTKKGSDDFNTVTGEVIENALHKGVFGIKNLSGETWSVTLSGKGTKTIDSGKGFPIMNGIVIDFNGIKGMI